MTFAGDSISGDLLKLVKVLTYLDDNLPDDIKMFFDKSLRHLKTPLMTIGEMFANELSLGEEDTVSVRVREMDVRLTRLCVQVGTWNNLN